MMSRTRMNESETEIDKNEIQQKRKEPKQNEKKNYPFFRRVPKWTMNQSE